MLGQGFPLFILKITRADTDFPAEDDPLYGGYGQILSGPAGGRPESAGVERRLVADAVPDDDRPGSIQAAAVIFCRSYPGSLLQNRSVP